MHLSRALGCFVGQLSNNSSITHPLSFFPFFFFSVDPSKLLLSFMLHCKVDFEAGKLILVWNMVGVKLEWAGLWVGLGLASACIGGGIGLSDGVERSHSGGLGVGLGLICLSFESGLKQRVRVFLLQEGLSNP